MFYDQANTFADDSPYQLVADKITAGWKQKPGYVLLPAVEYARHVVEKMIQRIPPQEVWCGTGINGLWWFEELRLTWLLDIVYSRHHGLNTSLV